MPASSKKSRRSNWLRALHQWHWISAAASLAGMMLFALTGLTLNHSGWVSGSSRVIQKQLHVPQALLSALPETPDTSLQSLPLPLENWLDTQLDVHIGGLPAEISRQEIYLAMPQPGADAWLAIDRATGDLDYEYRALGWIAYLNDLHKGRHTGTAWRWFIDAFAIACLVFSVSGLLLLKLHASNRASTWPLVGLGVLLPVLLMVFLGH
jgi:hypothetical protein